MAMSYSRNPEKDGRKYAGVWLSKVHYSKLRAVASREKRSIATILRFKVEQIVKQGNSGIDTAA